MLSLGTIAQNSNLIFFSESGETFKVFLNGVAQNPGYSSNVKVANLDQPYYRARVVFEDRSKGEINKNLNFNPNTETVFRIKLGNKGYVMRWQSEVPIAQAAPPAVGQTNIIYHSEPIQEEVASDQNSSTVSMQVTNSQSSSSSTQTSTAQPENINVSMSIPDVQMNVSMNLNESMTRVQGSSSEMTQTNSMTSSSSMTQTNTSQPEVMTTSPSASGCVNPASDSDFSSIRSSIESKTFRDDKLTVFKQVLRSRCFSTDQVKTMMSMFTYEDDKLEVAKLAYSKTVDQSNYYRINDAFTYSSSIDELNEFLELQE